MKEQERKQIIERIKKIQEEQKLLKLKRTKLKILSKHPAVQQYLKLLNDINVKEEQLKSFETLEQIINWEFSKALRFNRNDLTTCNHDIWIYEGSYYLIKDFLCEHDKEIKEYSEDVTIEYCDYEFLYNRYICLECGEKIEIKDWEQFENSQFVLKNQNSETDLGIEYYIDKYYQLLYKHNSIESQNLIIEEYNKNKQKIK